MKITVCGDSITKGVIFDEAKGRYTFMKNSAMHTLQSMLGAVIKNVSKFGCTTEKGQGIFQRNEQHIAESDFTILEYGGNDCDMPWDKIAENPDQIYEANVPEEQFEKNYEEMIMKTLNLGSTPVLMSLPPLDQDRFYSWVSSLAEKKTPDAEANILKYLDGTTETIYLWQQKYNSVVLRLAEKFHLPLIDVRNAFLKQENYKDFISIDGMHPNQKGQDLIAETSSDFFQNLCGQSEEQTTAA
ncbi:MAG: SGNH/GDSL hydrolase family protein [Eubacterium sp.]